MEDPDSGGAYQKIFDKIMKDRMENEYNRTKIEDRRGVLDDFRAKYKFNLNKSRGPRIVESFNSPGQSNRDNYVN